jgi:hypothetical protein
VAVERYPPLLESDRIHSYYRDFRSEAGSLFAPLEIVSAYIPVLENYICPVR